MILENINNYNLKELEHSSYSKNKTINKYAFKECVERFNTKENVVEKALELFYKYGGIDNAIHQWKN